MDDLGEVSGGTADTGLYYLRARYCDRPVLLDVAT
jgi:hypothetical protein